MADQDGTPGDRAAVEARLRSWASLVTLACLVLTGFAWAAYFVRLATALDVRLILTVPCFRGGDPALTPRDDLKVAVIATVLLPAIAAAYVWRARALWSGGVTATGKVTAVDALGQGRRVPASAVYKVGRVEYRTRVWRKEGAAVGDVVPILHDPRRPERVEVLGH